MRTRFAPSPTGELHVGNARVALFNWLLSKKTGGEFLVRIEDTDPERSSPEFEASILEDLRWFLNFRGEVVRQSERLSLYQQYAFRLLEEGKAYFCFCSEEELEALRKKRLSQGLPPRYDRRCLRLSQKEIEEFKASGRRPALRLKAEGDVYFEDMVFGPQHVKEDDLGDFIILRKDLWPTYNFACVIDDHLMEISHVIRGEDHLTNTARQILLYKALGWTPPQFAHLPLLLGPDRKVLSKRHGATSLRELRQMGILPQALANYLLHLGGGIGDEILDFDEMIKVFEITKIERSQPVFDFKKLLWFNREHLKRAEAPSLIALEGELDQKGVELFKDEVKTLSELKELIRLLKQEPNLEGIGDEVNRTVLQTALEELEGGKENWIKRVVERSLLSPKEVFLSLRLSLTGKKQGPSLEKVVLYLDEETIRRRLERALALGG